MVLASAFLASFLPASAIPLYMETELEVEISSGQSGIPLLQIPGGVLPPGNCDPDLSKNATRVMQLKRGSLLQC
jgi:hypothetical protein